MDLRIAKLVNSGKAIKKADEAVWLSACWVG